jgi:hypothetical protein
MGTYGVEEEFWVGDYRFEVNFSNDYAVGLCQRDIWVAQRKPLEDLALTDFTGPQLLRAYDGPDQDMRKEAFAQRLEALRTSYKEARRAPQANSTRLTRHEKKDITRLERALAQELCRLPRSHFDLNRVYAQVQHAEDNRFLRSFYFDEVNDRYIHHFCRKYAIDPAYRADVENGVVLWVERNALFLKNLESRAFRETLGELPPNDRGVAVLEALFEEQFFRWLCQHAKSILADPEYQRLKQRDQVSDAACRNGVVDPGMREVVAAWNTVPGVVVSSSCQGAGGVLSYGGKMLLVPSAHDECATIVVVLDDLAHQAVIEAIEQCLSAFPLICLTQFSRPVGSYREASRPHGQMRSQNVTSNTQVRQDLMTIAGEVRARWLR